jgi:hypothetical protein
VADDLLDIPLLDSAVAEARRRPCSGECSKMWDDKIGGWVSFDPPGWTCVECSRRINGSPENVQLPECACGYALEHYGPCRGSGEA